MHTVIELLRSAGTIAAMRDATVPIVVEELRPQRRSLRIAVVTETWPPEINGVAMTLARVVEGLRARDHAIQLVRPRQKQEAGVEGIDTGDSGDNVGTGGNDVDELLLRGLPIPRYPHLRLGLPSKKALLARWNLKRPDIVHIATEGPLGWSALQAALHLKLPVSSDFRTNFHAYSRHYGVGWLHKPILAYLRKFHNRTRCTMVPTEALRQQLVDAGFRNLRVLARGVDTALFDPARRSEALRATWGAGERTRVVLCVGRLAAEKNLGLLLAAFEAMRQIEPDMRLVLVGDGPESAALRKRCPSAVFAGARSGADLAAHYASADLFAFPSVTETFGNVTVEAMASGLPVLAFRYAAAERFIEPGVNGLTARFGDDADFVAQAVRLVGDPDFAASLGRQARQTALQHGWDPIVEQIERVMCAAVDQPA